VDSVPVTLGGKAIGTGYQGMLQRDYFSFRSDAHSFSGTAVAILQVAPFKDTFYLWHFMHSNGGGCSGFIIIKRFLPETLTRKISRERGRKAEDTVVEHAPGFFPGYTSCFPQSSRFYV